MPDLPDLKEVVATQGAGHDEAVVQQLKLLADAGEGRAYYALGLMALNGEGMARNYGAALGYFSAAQSFQVKVSDQQIAWASSHLSTAERQSAERYGVAHSRSAQAADLVERALQCGVAADKTATSVATPSGSTPMVLLAPPNPGDYYPRAARARGASADIVVSVLADTGGDLWDARIITQLQMSGTDDLSEAALRWTAKIKARPATQNGVPIVARKEFKIKWVADSTRRFVPDPQVVAKLESMAAAGDPAAQFTVAYTLREGLISPRLPELEIRHHSELLYQAALARLPEAQREVALDLYRRQCPALRPLAWSMMLRAAESGDGRAKLWVVKAIGSGTHQVPATLSPSSYLQELASSPDCYALKHAAFLMATSTDARLRNPPLALDTATRALQKCGAIDALEPELLLVQAAAFAANDKYTEAADSQRRAAGAAKKLGKQNGLWQSILLELQNRHWPDYGVVPLSLPWESLN